MICPKCGAVIAPRKNVCDSCGYSLAMRKKAHKLACYYYNRGLERAKLRDITGAIDNLVRCLELEKDYIDARNLLGLCYFEIGEAAQGLSQWIISKNYRDHNPTADRLIATVQNNAVKFNHCRAAIRKCNQALEVLKQDGDDLALIQLKKAVQYNPDYVKAWQLLALIYIRNEDYERARKCLKRSLKTDIANPTSLRYMKLIKDLRFKNLDIDVSISEKKEEDKDVRNILGGRVKQNIVPVSGVRDNNSEYKIFVSLMAGVLIGMMAVYFLVVPGIRQSLNYDMLGMEKESGEQAAEYLSEISSLETENASLQTKLELQELNVDEYKKKISELEGEKYFDNVINMIQYYEEITTGDGVVDDFQQYMLKQKLAAISEAELTNKNAKFLYDLVLIKFPDVMNKTYSGEELLSKGKAYMDAGDNENANYMFILSYQEAPDNEETLYLLGRSYQLIGDNTQARKYYDDYVNKYADGTYAATVKQWIASLQ